MTKEELLTILKVKMQSAGEEYKSYKKVKDEHGQGMANGKLNGLEIAYNLVHYLEPNPTTVPIVELGFKY